MVELSWHICGLSFYNIPPPSDALHVVFLQRLSEEERTQILSSLRDVDTEWAKSVDPDIKPRELLPTPWIRDHWPSSSTILTTLSQGLDSKHNSGRTYRSFILVDSGFEASTAIAARWESDENEENRLVAARVPLTDANILLTLCDRGTVPSLMNAIGEQQYEENRVDFTKDAKIETERAAVPASSAFQPPPFFPKDLSLSKTQLVINALLLLSADEMAVLSREIARDVDERRDGAAIVFHNWAGPTVPSRQDILQLYRWMQRNSAADCQDMYAFFVDYIVQDDEGRPRVLAVRDYDMERPDLVNQGVKLVPLTTEEVWSAWKAGTENAEFSTIEQDYGYPEACERLLDFTKPLNCALDFCCCVFYLEPFTIEQERAIRKALQVNFDGPTDNNMEFCYLGYLWPTGTEKHTIHELRDLSEKCDPLSPHFDPSYSNIRISVYPSEILAIDARYVVPRPKRRISAHHPSRILRPKKPQVLMGSGLDFWADPATRLGWCIGHLDAAEAHSIYVNFEIANIGPEEVLEDHEKLWLSDLTKYREEDYDEDE